MNMLPNATANYAYCVSWSSAAGFTPRFKHLGRLPVEASSADEAQKKNPKSQTKDLMASNAIKKRHGMGKPVRRTKTTPGGHDS